MNPDPQDLPVDPDIGELPSPPPPFGELLRRDADLLPVIAVGGALGSLARWGVAEAFPGTAFPWATFAVNIAGCALLGVLMALILDVWSDTRYLRPFVGVGMLGGFTTYSTAMLDLHRLLADDRLPLAATYLVGSLVLGLLAAFAGLDLTRRRLER